MLDKSRITYRDLFLDGLAQRLPGAIQSHHLTAIAFPCTLLACHSMVFNQGTFMRFAFWYLNRLLIELSGPILRHRGTFILRNGLLNTVCDTITQSSIPLAVALSKSRDDVEWFAVAALEGALHINLAAGSYILMISNEPAIRFSQVMQPMPTFENTKLEAMLTAMIIWPNWLANLSWLTVVGLLATILTRMVRLCKAWSFTQEVEAALLLLPSSQHQTASARSKRIPVLRTAIKRLAENSTVAALTP